MNRDAIAADLDKTGWPTVAEDVRAGLLQETILSRLEQIGEDDSEAYEIVATMDSES